MKNWRIILARLPLPLLALSASFGVWQFALLFVPWWVAVLQASAFEAVYLGLAVTQGLDAQQRRRATAISVGAVIVSVLYNTLAGLFHRNPAWLSQIPWYGEILGALLHGAPLAWIAYLVADLLLHSEQPAPNQLHTAFALLDQGTPWREIERQTGIPSTTLRRKMTTLVSNGHEEHIEVL